MPVNDTWRPGYRSLIGSNRESWGWDLGRNKLLHDCMRNPPRIYPRLLKDDVFVLSDTIRVVLDMDEGTLAFMADDVYLGEAFTGLKGLTLFPIVSAVWGHCAIRIRYLNTLHRGQSHSHLPHLPFHPTPSGHRLRYFS